MFEQTKTAADCGQKSPHFLFYPEFLLDNKNNIMTRLQKRTTDAKSGRASEIVCLCVCDVLETERRVKRRFQMFHCQKTMLLVLFFFPQPCIPAKLHYLNPLCGCYLSSCWCFFISRSLTMWASCVSEGMWCDSTCQPLSVRKTWSRLVHTHKILCLICFDFFISNIKKQISI